MQSAPRHSLLVTSTRDDGGQRVNVPRVARRVESSIDSPFRIFFLLPFSLSLSYFFFFFFHRARTRPFRSSLVSFPCASIFFSFLPSTACFALSLIYRSRVAWSSKENRNDEPSCDPRWKLGIVCSVQDRMLRTWWLSQIGVVLGGLLCVEFGRESQW